MDQRKVGITILPKRFFMKDNVGILTGRSKAPLTITNNPTPEEHIALLAYKIYPSMLESGTGACMAIIIKHAKILIRSRYRILFMTSIIDLFSVFHLYSHNHEIEDTPQYFAVILYS